MFPAETESGRINIYNFKAYALSEQGGFTSAEKIAALLEDKGNRISFAPLQKNSNAGGRSKNAEYECHKGTI